MHIHNYTHTYAYSYTYIRIILYSSQLHTHARKYVCTYVPTHTHTQSDASLLNDWHLSSSFYSISRSRKEDKFYFCWLHIMVSLINSLLACQCKMTVLIRMLKIHISAVNWYWTNIKVNNLILLYQQLPLNHFVTNLFGHITVI